MANRPPISEPAGTARPAAAVGRRGEPVTRRRVPTSTAGGGDIRVTWLADGAAHEATGDEAVGRLPELIAAPGAAVWVDLASPSPEEVERVGALLGLHPLIVEDVLEGNQRPKLEQTDGLVHLVIFRLDYDEAVHAIEVDLVLGTGFLLSVHDRAWDPRTAHHLRRGPGPLLEHGPDHLLWALCDDIVDAYFPFGDRLGDELDRVQDEVVEGIGPEVLRRVFTLKRELHEVRRLISPVREVFNQLTTRDTALIDDEELVYFRDVYDHVIRLTDELDNYREIASATLDVYLTQVNNSLSVIMKRLTGVTVILAGVGAVAGIFGMSEAAAALGGTEAGGFWLVVLLTVGAAAVAAWVLRRIDWI